MERMLVVKGRFKIQNFYDREKFITSLANSGYFCRVVEEKSKISSEFFVEVLVDEEYVEPKKKKEKK